MKIHAITGRGSFTLNIHAALFERAYTTHYGNKSAAPYALTNKELQMLLIMCREAISISDTETNENIEYVDIVREFLDEAKLSGREAQRKLFEKELARL